VLIVGAGSAGLLTAIALKRAKISCTVFEQDLSLMKRPLDWNFGIYWAQSRLDEVLKPELRALIKTVQTDPTYTPNPDSFMPAHNGQTGELMKNIPAPYSLRLRRKKWLQLLSQEDLDIRWGKELQKIQTTDDSVTLSFADGSQESGSLLIGAEGAHSFTRKYLLGEEEAKLVDSEVVATFALAKLDRETATNLRKLHPRYTIAFHPNGTFFFTSIQDSTSEDPADWVWMLTQTWETEMPTLLEGPALLADWKEKGSHFGSPFKEIFTGINEDGAIMWHNRLAYWPTKPWDDRGGKITLVGDAAHPMTFHRGQGLNNAISDAASILQFINAMKDHTKEELVDAIRKYEKELWPRGHEAVLASLENTLMMHDWNSVMKSPLFVGGMVQNAKPAV